MEDKHILAENEIQSDIWILHGEFAKQCGEWYGTHYDYMKCNGKNKNKQLIVGILTKNKVGSRCK